ncbi:MAG: LLM class flavin-dependent oxidoreductase [Dehalococcoidia bacterium]|nr:LLM class flavin-dependent oxidoreductase [Dehalococcoidia bacterium]
MHISLFHPAGDFEQLVEATQCAEEAGFHGCYFGEHHGAPASDRPQLLVLLAALAARTSSIRLGTSILLSPLYDPMQVAESASMVDVISRGRLDLGLGLGYQPRDFQQFNVPFKQRVSRFEESVEVLRQAWSGGRFSYRGRRFAYDDVAVYPRPVQRPHPPIWLAAWSLPGAARAGRLGDAYVTDPIQNLNAIKAFAERYRAASSDAGKPGEIVLMREFLCAPTRSEAYDRYAEGVLAQYRYYWQNGAFNAEFDPWIADIGDRSEITWDMVSGERVIYGTPDDCIGQLEHWARELGTDHIQLAVPHRRDMTPAQQLDTIRLVGEEVIPKLGK